MATAGCPTRRQASTTRRRYASTLQILHDERANQGKPRLDTIFKLSVSGHADPALEHDVAELAALGFDEIIVQGIWDAGIDPGMAAIERVRAVLDA